MEQNLKKGINEVAGNIIGKKKKHHKGIAGLMKNIK
jgi:hypothetical protein